jgi:hypothetical protein
MLSASSGAERSAAHFEALFRAADPRFRLLRVGKEEGSAMGLLEFGLAETA